MGRNHCHLARDFLDQTGITRTARIGKARGDHLIRLDRCLKEVRGTGIAHGEGCHGHLVDQRNRVVAGTAIQRFVFGREHHQIFGVQIDRPHQCREKGGGV